jgi:hypothetical protein
MEIRKKIISPMNRSLSFDRSFDERAMEEVNGSKISTLYLPGHRTPRS